MSVRLVHMVLSVDVDRFSDAKIRRDFLGMFAQLGAVTVADVRRICAEYRAKGYEAFPSCEHHDSRGYCLGHEQPNPPECRPDATHPHRCTVHDLRLLNARGACGATR